MYGKIRKKQDCWTSEAEPGRPADSEKTGKNKGLIKLSSENKQKAKRLLDVRDLKIHFPITGGVFWRKIGTVYAVDGVSLSVNTGETLGIVGESGCGKTTLGRSILGLYKPAGGDIRFKGENIAELSRKKIRAIRRNMQMVFQDPYESLDSKQTIGSILEEPFQIHKIGAGSERKEQVARLLERVGLSADAVTKYPHEFSGGQRQRIGIARAIALQPELVVCDEPVSALDVSIQSQILNLLLDLQHEMNMSYVFITHDLSIVKHMSDFVAVMYLGKIVEYASADDLYKKPLHPYTQNLIASIPTPDPFSEKKRYPLTGETPSPINPPPGCYFHPRCPAAVLQCATERPELINYGENGDLHSVACHLVSLSG